MGPWVGKRPVALDRAERGGWRPFSVNPDDRERRREREHAIEERVGWELPLPLSPPLPAASALPAPSPPITSSGLR